MHSIQTPTNVQSILARSQEIGFEMMSDPLVGALLKTLVASKTAGQMLELGTGTGLATAWLLDGMDGDSTLVTVENEAEYAAIARFHLAYDSRVTFKREDAGQFLEHLDESDRFDLVFADTWAGKYTHCDRALNALNLGGLYVIDDMLPQSNWPEGHETQVARLIAQLHNRADLSLVQLDWASGVIIATRHN
ncbi:MAG: class I SAM-dependent methyltransferase [Cyanobacteria bacterium P01_F01_bin.33]